MANLLNKLSNCVYLTICLVMLSRNCVPCPSIFSLSLFFSLTCRFVLQALKQLIPFLYSVPTEMDVPAYLVELQGRLMPVIGGMQA